MYKQKNYKTLSKENMEVAIEVVKYLKENKTISGNTFTRIFTQTRGLSPNTPKQNWYNIYLFLLDHELITRHYINGFGIYVATPKCSRTFMNNMFREFQYVYEKDIDEAVKWQETNKGLVPIEIEAQVIGEKILGLTGDALKRFIEMTILIQGYNDEANGQPFHNTTFNFYRKMSFLNALRQLGWLIKKV